MFSKSTGEVREKPSDLILTERKILPSGRNGQYRSRLTQRGDRMNTQNKDSSWQNAKGLLGVRMKGYRSGNSLWWETVQLSFPTAWRSGKETRLLPYYPTSPERTWKFISRRKRSVVGYSNSIFLIHRYTLPKDTAFFYYYMGIVE